MTSFIIVGCVITPSTALITPCPDNAFRNQLAANVPNNIPRNPPFCYFASFSIASLIPFIIYLDFSSDLTIFIISSIPFFEIINAVVHDPWSVANISGVNSNGNKILLDRSVSTLFH